MFEMYYIDDTVVIDIQYIKSTSNGDRTRADIHP